MQYPLNIFLLLFFGIQSFQTLGQESLSYTDSIVRVIDNQQGNEKLQTILQTLNALRLPDALYTYYASKGLQLAEQLQASDEKAMIHFLLGQFYYFHGNTEKQAFHIEMCGVSAANSKQPLIKGYYYLNEGLSLNHNMKIETKIKMLQKALQAIDSTDFHAEKAYFLLLIGNIYNNFNKPEVALSFLKKGLKEVAYEPKKFPFVEPNIYSTIAWSYLERKDYNKCQKFSKKGIQLIEKIPFQNIHLTRTKGWLFNNLGTVAYESGDLEKSLENYHKATEQFQSIGGDYGLSRIYLKVSKAYMENQLFEEAEVLIKQATELAKENLEPEDLRDAFALLAKVYEQQGNYEKAYRLVQKSCAIKDSLMSVIANRQLAAFQTEFQTLQKEQENELLRKDAQIQKGQLKIAVTVSVLMLGLLGVISMLYVQLGKNKKQLELQHRVIKDKNEELDKLNHTKDRFFAIIAHDLRGPITAFQGISKKIDFFLKKGKTERIIQMGEQIDRAAQHVHTLLDNLLQWALLQQKTIDYSPEYIALHKLVDQALNSYENLAVAHAIELKKDIPDHISVIADTNALSTIIRNLVGNALKFTPEYGTVLVTVQEYENQIQLKVSDTGIGISPEKMRELFQVGKEKAKTGLHGEKGTGLGLNLCYEFAELNQGTLKVESELNKGTTFILTLPKPIESLVA